MITQELHTEKRARSLLGIRKYVFRVGSGWYRCDSQIAVRMRCLTCSNPPGNAPEFPSKPGCFWKDSKDLPGSHPRKTDEALSRKCRPTLRSMFSSHNPGLKRVNTLNEHCPAEPYHLTEDLANTVALHPPPLKDRLDVLEGIKWFPGIVIGTHPFFVAHLWMFQAGMLGIVPVQIGLNPYSFLYQTLVIFPKISGSIGPFRCSRGPLPEMRACIYSGCWGWCGAFSRWVGVPRIFPADFFLRIKVDQSKGGRSEALLLYRKSSINALFSGDKSLKCTPQWIFLFSILTM